MTDRKTDMEMEDIRHTALTMTDRRALAEALETRHGAPEDKADAVLTDLFRYGGTLSIAGERVKRTGRHRVLLRLHGLTVGGASVEEAAATWRDAAHASLSGETET